MTSLRPVSTFPFPRIFVLLDVIVKHFEAPRARGAGLVREKLRERGAVFRATVLCSSGSAGRSGGISAMNADACLR